MTYTIRRFTWTSALALLASVSAAHAQTWVVNPPKPISIKRLHFVLDVSGSMKTDLAQLLATVKTLAPPGSDECEIKVTVFSEETKTWGRGKNGWVALPGPEDMRAVAELVESLQHGNTYVLPALTLALAEPAKKGAPPITVVLVSDGVFFDPGGSMQIAVRAAASPHGLLIVGVGRGEHTEELASIARASGAGYLSHRAQAEAAKKE